MAKDSSTKPTDVDVADVLAIVPNGVRRRDAARLVELMSRITGTAPRMWGTSIIGFGTYHYRYDSGREGDMPAASFAPRSRATTVYLMDGVEAHADRLARLGPHTTGKGCLYIPDLEHVDADVLEDIVTASWTALTSGVFGGRA
jgi:hypothetical protein